MSHNPPAGLSLAERTQPLGVPSLWAGDVLLPLRLIVGWTYFSAFWRRLVLEDKLVPESAGYIGEKFNHFLPNALAIGPIIEFFLRHPELLWWKLVAFTVVEGVVGLAMMAGWMTRLAGLATSGLALGILLGAGWLGTTCLDEWQIGILGIGSGLAVAFAGGGRFSIDLLIARRWGPTGSRWLGWTRSLTSPAWLHRPVVIGGVAVACLGITLLTNQVFHGGVWGKLHNLSVKPRVELSNAQVAGDTLSVRLYRVEGADVYGSFAIGLSLQDAQGNPVAQWTAEDLAQLPAGAIDNHYVAKVQAGKHALILPLGAKADVHLQSPELHNLIPGEYRVELTDVSGVTWSTTFDVST